MSYFSLLALFISVLFWRDAASIQVASHSNTELNSQSHKDSVESKVSTQALGIRGKYVTLGYRIQVYTGANNRAARKEAQRVKEQIQKHFPELAAYVHFQSPRWICRVGDFVTAEEADSYLKLIKKKRLSLEARIVSSKVIRIY